MTTGKVEVYGATWCGDTRRALEYFDSHGVLYDWNDVDEDKHADDYVREVNGGSQVVPVIRFPDGSILVEPSNAELEDKLANSSRTD